MIFKNIIMLCVCLISLISSLINPVICDRLSHYIRNFEGIHYDTSSLHTQHMLTRRSTNHLASQPEITVQFRAHNKPFAIRLTRPGGVFADGATLQVSGQKSRRISDFSYVGYLDDMPNSSRIFGSVIDGRFEGRISTPTESYHIELADRYFPRKNVSFHSVIYKESDIEFPLDFRGGGAGCGIDKETLDWMHRIQLDGVPVGPTGASRPGRPSHKYSKTANSDKNIKHGKSRAKRNVPEKNTCVLYIQTDHLFFEANDRNEDSVLHKVTTMVGAVNDIFEDTNFNGIQGIGFAIKRIVVNTTADKHDPSNPYRGDKIGISKMLSLLSEENHDAYCLAFVFTHRDFDNGVLGLAWVAMEGAKGGVCEKHSMFISAPVGQSLNTGIVTTLNYGKPVPPRSSQITFAHELGHNLGSPHDYPLQCRPDDSLGGKFIMYDSATTSTFPNNDQFSACSIGNISVILKNPVKNKCLVDSKRAICGNKIREADEECDCGFKGDDECEMLCCHPADDSDTDKRCRLMQRAGVECDPSQGHCCANDGCVFVPHTGDPEQNTVCMEAGDCHEKVVCNGTSAACPVPAAKADMSECADGTMLCDKGECSLSICNKIDKEQCACARDETSGTSTLFDERMCQVCCRSPEESPLCEPYSEPGGNGTALNLNPGSACDEQRGYCDVFYRCRPVDANGPLSRLTNALFNPQLYQGILTWMGSYWWAMVLICIGVIAFMALFIKVCSVHTPSSNPRARPAKQLGTLPREIATTLRRGSQAYRQTHAARRQPREAVALPLDSRHSGRSRAPPPAHQPADYRYNEGYLVQDPAYQPAVPPRDQSLASVPYPGSRPTPVPVGEAPPPYQLSEIQYHQGGRGSRRRENQR